MNTNISHRLTDKALIHNLRLGRTHAQLAAQLGYTREAISMRIMRDPDLRAKWQRQRLTNALQKRAKLLYRMKKAKTRVTIAQLRMRIIRNDLEIVKAAKYRYGAAWPEKLARRLGTRAERAMPSLALPYVPTVAYSVHGLHPKLPRSPWHSSNNAAQHEQSA